MHRVVCFVVARSSFRTWSSSRTWATGRWRRAPPTSAPCPFSPGAALTTHVTSSCPPTTTLSRCSRAGDGQCSHIARLFQPLACYSSHTLFKKIDTCFKVACTFTTTPSLTLVGAFFKTSVYLQHYLLPRRTIM